MSDPWGFAVSLGGFLVVVAQLRIEPRRRRREAAIAAYQDTLQLRQELKEDLPPRHDHDELERFNELAISQFLGEDGRQHRALMHYLNYWETISAAALRGVIDVTVLDAVAGRTLLALRSNYGAYIAAVQETQAVAYEQLLCLCDDVLQSPRPASKRVWLALTRGLPGGHD